MQKYIKIEISQHFLEFQIYFWSFSVPEGVHVENNLDDLLPGFSDYTKFPGIWSRWLIVHNRILEGSPNRPPQHNVSKHLLGVLGRDPLGNIYARSDDESQSVTGHTGRRQGQSFFLCNSRQMKIVIAKVVWDLDEAVSKGASWTTTQHKNYEPSSVRWQKLASTLRFYIYRVSLVH